MPSLRRTIATSPNPLAKLARRTYHGIAKFSLPVPIVLVRPIVRVYFAVRSVSRFLKRVVIAEPYFKAMCASYGRNLHTGVWLHFFSGRGAIIVGNDVTFDGKSSFLFAARFSDQPTLEVGDSTDFGHNCMFTIGKRITVGSHCMVASGVWMFDSNGHPTDPAARLAGLPPSPDEVKPITIEDNVWIGRNCTIYPGVRVGAGSVVSTGAVVVGDVPAYTVVAGNPARKIATLTPPAAPPTPPDESDGSRGPAPRTTDAHPVAEPSRE